MNQPIPAPETVTDVDGSLIGQAYELDCGAVYTLADGGFMVAIDSVIDRGDVEQLCKLLGQVLERGAVAVS